MGFAVAAVATLAFLTLVTVALWIWGAGAFLVAVVLSALAVSASLFVLRKHVPLGWVGIALMIEIVAGLAAIVVWASITNLGFQD